MLPVSSTKVCVDKHLKRNLCSYTDQHQWNPAVKKNAEFE